MMRILQERAARIFERFDALKRKPVRGGIRRDAGFPGDVEDAGDAVIDPADLLPGAVLVIAVQLVGNIDDAAGVNDVIRRVDDAQLVNQVSVPGFLQLVVGRAGNNLCLQLRNTFIIDDGAQRTGEKISQSTPTISPGATAVALYFSTARLTASALISVTISRAPS